MLAGQRSLFAHSKKCPARTHLLRESRCKEELAFDDPPAALGVIHLAPIDLPRHHWCRGPQRPMCGRSPTGRNDMPVQQGATRALETTPAIWAPPFCDSRKGLPTKIAKPCGSGAASVLSYVRCKTGYGYVVIRLITESRMCPYMRLRAAGTLPPAARIAFLLGREGLLFFKSFLKEGERSQTWQTLQPAANMLQS